MHAQSVEEGLHGKGGEDCGAIGGDVLGHAPVGEVAAVSAMVR